MKKLTKQQNMVINCLQNGWELITDSEMLGAIVATTKYQFHIGNRLFFNLVDLELISQGLGGKYDGYSYKLTELGKETKTKDVQKSIIENIK